MKRNDPQTFKNGTSKKPFLQCVCYWYKMLQLITGGRYFSWIINVNLRFLKCLVAAFFKASVVREVRILCVISTITIRSYYQSSKIKPNFLNFFIFVTNFTFVTVPYFSLQLNFFSLQMTFLNLKPLWKHVFYEAILMFQQSVSIKW